MTLPAGFKPNLAGNATDALDKLVFPVYASPKIDGVRMIVDEDGTTYSRSLKPIPNAALREYIKENLRHQHGVPFDGELVAGSWRDKNVMQNTTSAFMSKSKGLPWDWTFYVFDAVTDEPFDARQLGLEYWFENGAPAHIKHLPSKLIYDLDALLRYEKWAVMTGFEGIMVRGTDSMYKFGRSTVKEQGLLKIKRFDDAEGVVIGFKEEMHNANEATTNALGQTERSSKADGLVGKGTLGALVVRVLTGPFAGTEAELGTGFSAFHRASLWERRDAQLGRVVKFKYFAHGCVEKVRHPVFLGFRAKEDM